MKTKIQSAVLISLALFVTSAAFAQGTKAKTKAPSKSIESTTVTPAPARTHSYSSMNSGEYLNEIQTSFVGGSFQNYKTGSQSVTQLTGTASYARLIRPLIQVGGEVGLSYVNAATTTTTLTALAIGKYNFDSDLKESFYVDAGAGILSAVNNTGGTDTKFSFMVGGGRRIPLWERISYNPEARLYKKGDLDPNIEIQFLNLSIMY